MTSILECIGEIGEFIQVTTTIDLCRDPEDNFLLALAKDGRADYLLTGDNDLLVLNQFEQTKIVKISDFIQMLDK